eukprot:GGOE01000809.1.p1 GENE.GGOE01000809.1~~GGOE01000809.1.p1  ORF type:complete len:210 (-),score=45.45 GGOE01000809.1:127-756(-)
MQNDDDDDDDAFFKYKGEKLITGKFTFHETESDDDVSFQGISATHPSPTARPSKKQKTSFLDKPVPALEEGTDTDDILLSAAALEQFADSMEALNKSAALLHRLEERPKSAVSDNVLTGADLDLDPAPSPLDHTSPFSPISLKVQGKVFADRSFIVQAGDTVDSLRSQIDAHAGQVGAVLVLDGKVLCGHQRWEDLGVEDDDLIDVHFP